MFDDFFFRDQFVAGRFDFIEDLCDIDLVNFENPLNHTLLSLGLLDLSISLHVVFFEPLIDLPHKSLVFNRCLRFIVHVLPETEAALDPYLNCGLQLLIEVESGLFLSVFF